MHFLNFTLNNLLKTPENEACVFGGCPMKSEEILDLLKAKLLYKFNLYTSPGTRACHFHLQLDQALTVRFLTKRYIGEYDHQQDSKYRHEVLLDGDPILFEILDTCPKSTEDMPASDIAQWADGLCLVYSITDRASFNFVRRAKQNLHSDKPLTLVGNKADMVHLRQVSMDEGEILAKDFECTFREVAAAEQVDQVGEVFQELCREVLAIRRRNSKHSSLLDRMLGTKTAYKVYSRGKSDSALPKD